MVLENFTLLGFRCARNGKPLRQPELTGMPAASRHSPCPSFDHRQLAVARRSARSQGPTQGHRGAPRGARLECDAVRSAVQAGSSWSDVAGALGVSKQSAQSDSPAAWQSPPRRIRGVDASAPPEIVVTAGPPRGPWRARRGTGAPPRRGRLLAPLAGPACRSRRSGFGRAGGDRRRVQRAARGGGRPAGPRPAGDAPPRRIDRRPGARARAVAARGPSPRPRHWASSTCCSGTCATRTAARSRRWPRSTPPIDLERCLGKLLMEAPFASA